MIETVYYTYSTIAQVLAALVALTGVFAVFRVSALLKRVEGYAQIFYNVAEGWEVPKASKINLWAAKLGKDYPKAILPPLHQSPDACASGLFYFNHKPCAYFHQLLLA